METTQLCQLNIHDSVSKYLSMVISRNVMVQRLLLMLKSKAEQFTIHKITYQKSEILQDKGKVVKNNTNTDTK